MMVHCGRAAVCLDRQPVQLNVMAADLSKALGGAKLETAWSEVRAAPVSLDGSCRRAVGDGERAGDPETFVAELARFPDPCGQGIP